MKKRRLPEIDLARISPLSRDKKYTELRHVRDGQPRISYTPLRDHFPDIMNVQLGMFGPAEHTDWKILERLIGKAAKSEKERAANLGVAKALHTFNKEHEVRARTHDFPLFHVASGGKIAFWLDMIVVYDGKPVVPFIDPRRSHGLTAEGRRFVFSMMHENIRVDPDFSEISLGIIQFAKADDNQRSPILHLDRGIPLYGHWEINEMMSETHEIWHEVCEEEAKEARRKASGGKGTLL